MTPSNLSGALDVSPLHAYWSNRMLTNAWMPVGGLTLPGEISGTDEEIAAFGAGAAFADISNRAVVSISGPDAAAFASALSGDPEESFAPNRDRPVVWCGADGVARGAGRVAMRGPEEAVLVSEVFDRAWLAAAAQPFDVRLDQAAAAGLRLAGPQTQDLLKACDASPGGACDLNFPGLGPVLALPFRPDAVDLWVEPDNAQGLAWMLERAGAKPAGRVALNAWRTASGYLAAGQDWTPAQACVTRAAMRTREQLTSGVYVLAAWNGPPPSEVVGAVAWPALGQWFAILWQPPQPGRAQAAPGGSVILGPAATD